LDQTAASVEADVIEPRVTESNVASLPGENANAAEEPEGERFSWMQRVRRWLGRLA